MKCLACKTNNPESARFCNQCGSSMESLCPVCGQSNPPDSNFCNQCGHHLGSKNLQLPTIKRNPLSYTPKFLIDKILTNRTSIEGERKLVTVLFADVADFTGVSETLDPEEIHQIMDGCFTILMKEIHNVEGTINQFTGDGVMALFGGSAGP
jgi:ribosomal protein L40E